MASDKKLAGISRSRLGDLLMQVLTIVLSVLLALAMNDWRESRNTRYKVDALLASLHAEVLENQDSIEASLAHHKGLVSELRQGGKQVAVIKSPARGFNWRNPEQSKRRLRQAFIDQRIPLPMINDLLPVRDDRFLLRFVDRTAIVQVEGDSLKLFAESGIQLRSASLRNLSWETAQAMQVLVHIDYDIVQKWAGIYRLQKQHDATAATILDILYRGNSSILPVLEDLVHLQSVLLEKYLGVLKIVNMES